MSEVYIKKELISMGFPPKMINALLLYEAVEDTNEAVDKLIKHPNGWSHKFSGNDFEQLC